MLQNIHIQNFRCFEDFKAEGFERINLIGGKNNSGKSCLLEGIACLSGTFDFNKVLEIRGLQAGEYAFNKKNYLPTSIDALMNKEIISFSVVRGIITLCNLNINFINDKLEIPNLDIIASFDKFDELLIKNKLIEILNSIDERIEDIRTFKTKEGLWIRKKGEEYQSISTYGDATNKLIKYFTPFFEKELWGKGFITSEDYSFLLIDEIENGIHYTAHKEFWQHLFKLTKELNVQVFATTHSLEMIKAFNEVALQEGEAAYFEMVRDVNSNEIFAQKRDVEQLEYAIETEKTFRGE